jgi:oligosaccharide repeat unit polymerase
LGLGEKNEMISIPNQILLFWFISSILLHLILKKYSIFSVLILTWWCFWSFINSLDITGLFSIRQSTQNLYFLFFIGLLLGSFSYGLKQNRVKLKNIIYIPRFKYKVLNRNIFIFYLTCITPIVFYFFIRALYLMNTEFTMHEYRSDVFGLLTGTSTLFHHSRLISLLYFWIINPFQYSAIFLGISSKFYLKNNNLFILSMVLLMMDAIILAGRFALHFMLTIILVVLILDFLNSGSFKKFIYKNRFFIILIPLVMLVTILLTYIRDPFSIDSFFSSLKLYILIYHSESFTIFDRELLNQNSIVHDLTYGKSFFGGILKYPILLLNYFGMNIVSEETRIGSYLHKNIFIGYFNDRTPITLNAFGSVFFCMYRDGREYFIFGCGILYGYLVANFSTAFSSINPLKLAFLVSLIFIGIYGIFQPYIDGAILPSIVLVFFFIGIPSIKNNYK